MGVILGLLPSWLGASAAVQALSAVALRVADFSLALVDILLAALLLVCGIGTLTALVATPVASLSCAGTYRIGLLCAIVPLGLQASESVYFGEACVRVVDVGQGSAAMIDTARHRMLVDTGPRFGSGDVGRSHILAHAQVYWAT